MATNGYDHLIKQAGWCRVLGSPFTGDVLETLANTLTRDSETGRRLLDWPGDADDDAISMRIGGALHALARRGTEPALSSLYAARGGDLAGLLPGIVEKHDAWLSTWLTRPRPMK